MKRGIYAEQIEALQFFTYLKAELRLYFVKDSAPQSKVKNYLFFLQKTLDSQQIDLEH